MADVDVNESRFENEEITLKDLSLGFPIAKGCSAVVYAAKFDITTKVNKDAEPLKVVESKNVIDYPFALKMMFNYDIQSNAMAILKAMYRETIPARRYYENEHGIEWEKSLAERKPTLPAHPNIVAMYSVFADYIPNLRDSLSLFPDALPARINPDGYGRNMSLFLLMKR